MGSDEVWETATKALQDALDERGMEYKINEGDGAFYGPKIDFHLRDSIGRTWQCGTIQLDMLMPENFDLNYIGEDGQKHRPVMIHRVAYGSLERFIGILIEHFAGAFPAWLAPVQAVVFGVTDAQSDYVRNTVNALKRTGVRAVADLRNEKVGYKVREHTLQRVPYLLVAGEREKSEGTVSVRDVAGKDLGVMTLEQVAALMLRQHALA